MAILIFFVVHWQLSVFFQSFFQHRYAAHGQFRLSKGWERVFHFLTWFVQGSSYLVPRAYAILHRMHHAYSDTEKDPHSPALYGNPGTMMWATKKRYHELVHREVEPEARFAGNVPEWPLIDRIGEHWGGRLAWGTVYFFIYVAFASTPWLFLLLPFHWALGPVHGAIVNWAGHRYGYRNFQSSDLSRNTVPWDLITAGELTQNNHHEHASSPSFAYRWYELDTTWQVMRVLSWLRIIELRTAPARPPRRRPAEARTPLSLSSAAPDGRSGSSRSRWRRAPRPPR